MRGGNHSKDIRQYEITSKGMVIMRDSGAFEPNRQ
jgi:hypothetical protein